MVNNKTNVFIATCILVLMLFAVFCGLFDRFDYENNTKNIYLSANYEDLKESKAEITSTLEKMKKSGVKFVTVSPMTFFDMYKSEKLDAITFSSLKINEDDISKRIYASLKTASYSDNDVVIISTKEETTKFLEENLNMRYDVTEKLINETTTVFLVKGKTKNDDFIIGYDDKEIEEIKKSGLGVALLYPGYAFENENYAGYFSKLLFKYDVKFLVLRKNENENKVSLSEEFKQSLRKTDTALVVFENENQVKNEEPVIFNDMAEVFRENTVRGFNMDKTLSYDKTKYKYRYYQWYNSALERNTTFLNVNILKNEGEDINSNIALTLKAVEEFHGKLINMGYSFPDSKAPVAYRYNLQTSSLCCGIVIVLMIYIYLYMLGFESKKLFPILGPAGILLMIASYMFYDYVTKYYAIILMVLTVSLLTLIIFRIVNSDMSKRNKFLLSLASMVCAFIAGSILITAMFSDIDFYLGNKWVTGVKISLILPFATTIYNYNSVFLKFTSIKAAWEKAKEKIKKIPMHILIIAGVCVVMAGAYYLIRTGKSNLISPLEDNFRKKLTDVFTIRPRTKEFLIGYPCFAVFLYVSILRKNKTLQMIFGILTTILFTSVLNTFCHAFTDFSVSVLRVLTGILAGAFVSAVVIGIWELVLFVVPKIKEQKSDVKKSACEGEFVPVLLCASECVNSEKAKKWLDDNNIKYTERNMNECKPSLKELKAWQEKSGLPLKKFFHTTSPLFKSMDLKTKLPVMNEKKQLKLLSKEPALIKTPLFIGDKFVLVGFKESVWNKKISTTKD